MLLVAEASSNRPDGGAHRETHGDPEARVVGQDTHDTSDDNADTDARDATNFSVLVLLIFLSSHLRKLRRAEPTVKGH